MQKSNGQKPTILFVNGSLGGAKGNTAQVIARFRGELAEDFQIESLHLADQRPQLNELKTLLSSADGFLFSTGTYWDSWGSPMQSFLESTTEFEGEHIWLGKPAAVVVTMHSVGGKEVLNRLQGVLNTLGLLIPPMSGLVYSLANHLALETNSLKLQSHRSDLWSLDDVPVVAKNLALATNAFSVARAAEKNDTKSETRRSHWSAWDVDKSDPRRRWL